VNVASNVMTAPEKIIWYELPECLLSKVKWYYIAHRLPFKEKENTTGELEL
jgi:hypothetical protein